MPKAKPQTVILIDCDTVAFRSSAAVEQRTVIVKHLKSGQEKEFTNRSAFREVLKEKHGDNWKAYENRYSYTDVQTAQSLGIALNNIKARIHLLEKELKADKTVLVIGGESNFRATLPLPSQYKGSRTDLLRPVHLSEARNYIRKTLKAKVADGIEADDLLNILAYEELRKGNKAIICSQDKDSAQSDGIFWYNWVEDAAEITEIPLIGDLWLAEDGKTVKGLGFRFFAFQLIFGDLADNYKPFEVSKTLKRYGQATAYKDLKDLATGKEIADKVVELYQKAYPDVVEYTSWNGQEVKTDWQGMLDMYFKCAYMLRSQDDKTTWKDFFKERGWNENTG